VPRLGALRLRVLDPGHVNKMYRELGQARGGRRGESLAPATRRHIHTTLRRALRDAVKWGLVSRNAAALADPPRVDRHNRTMNVWTREQIRTFLNHVADDRLFAMWRVFATTGMRRGEVCGLQWKHIDFERSLLTVRQARVNVGYKVQLGTTKTGASRVIPVGLNTVAALKAWRDRQADEFLELEIAQSPDHYLFTDKAGEPLHPDRVTKLFDQAVKAAGLPRIRLHDVRHSYATIGLLNGIHPKVMAERLGHADVMITLQTYSHVLKGMQESAAELLEASIDSE
jgi:integrase